MDTPRKLEIFDQAVKLIASGGDDSAVRFALLEECSKRIDAAKAGIVAASKAQVAAALSSKE